ncbi:MAG: hypothetical protein U1D30_25335 [Planctomycetota bacterium]
MSSLAPFAEWLCAILLSAGALPASVTIEEDPSATEVRCEALQAPKDPDVTRALQKVQPSERLAQQDTLGHLAVQHALREGKKLLDDQRYEDAIRVLEPHLAKANGSEEFLEALEAAYRGQTSYLINRRELDAARLVAQRLRILSPSDELSIPEKTDVRTLASLAAASNGPSERKPSAEKTPNPAKPKEEPSTAPAKPIGRALVETVVNASSAIAAVALDKSPTPSASPEKETEPATPAVKPAVAVARGRMEEPGEEIQTASLSRIEKPSFLDQADRHFQTGRFGDALACYERAYQEDPVSVQAGRERWGYCLLYVTVERYNEFVQGKRTIDSPDIWAHLESDVKLSRRLAPSLKYADTVLEAIQKQKQPATSAVKDMSAVAAQTPKSAGAGPGVDQYRGATQQPVPSRNLVHLPGRSQPGRSPRPATSASITATHRLQNRSANWPKVAREFAHQKWFLGEPMEDWNPICEVYLYPTVDEYSQSTGVPPQSSRPHEGSSPITAESSAEISTCEPTIRTCWKPFFPTKSFTSCSPAGLECTPFPAGRTKGWSS